jgi:hypothetical protein
MHCPFYPATACDRAANCVLKLIVLRIAPRLPAPAGVPRLYQGEKRRAFNKQYYS